MFPTKLLLYPTELKDRKFKGLQTLILSNRGKRIRLAHGFLNLRHANTYCVVYHHTPVISDKLNKSTNLTL